VKPCAYLVALANGSRSQHCRCLVLGIIANMNVEVDGRNSTRSSNFLAGRMKTLRTHVAAHGAAYLAYFWCVSCSV
jgi:hypothetical protein